MPVPRLINTFEKLINYLEKHELTILDLVNVGDIGLKYLHRFDPKGKVCGYLLEIFRRVDLENEVKELYKRGDLETLIRGLLHLLYRELDKLIREKRLNEDVIYSFGRIVPRPDSMSTLKRLCLFLRWVVRKEYPDLGLWRFVEPSSLYIPLDKGVARIISRMSRIDIKLNWNSVKELTTVFKAIEPHDPSKYDFSLSRMAILDICKLSLEESDCDVCPLMDCCKSSQLTIRKIERAHIKGEKVDAEHKYIQEMFKRMNPWHVKCVTEHVLNGVADIVCFEPTVEKPEIIYVAEVKVKADLSALSQVLRYASQLKKRYPTANIKSVAIVAKEITPETLEAADYRNVEAWIWNENAGMFLNALKI